MPFICGNNIVLMSILPDARKVTPPLFLVAVCMICLKTFLLSNYPFIFSVITDEIGFLSAILPFGFYILWFLSVPLSFITIFFCVRSIFSSVFIPLLFLKHIYFSYFLCSCLEDYNFHLR